MLDSSASSASVGLMSDGLPFDVVSESSDSFGPEAVVLLALGLESGEKVCKIVGDSLVLAIRVFVFRFSCNGDRAGRGGIGGLAIRFVFRFSCNRDRGSIGGLVNPEDIDEVLVLDCRRP